MTRLRALKPGAPVILGLLHCCACNTESHEANPNPADAATDGNTSTGAEAGTTPAGPETVPTAAGDLRAYLEDRRYLGFDAEPLAHASSGPHVGQVRVHVNAKLARSLSTGAQEHPSGSAAVKELFSSDGSLSPSGWAVMVKLPDGEYGGGWFWYERVEGTLSGVRGCADCHQSGSDFVLTAYPFD